MFDLKIPTHRRGFLGTMAASAAGRWPRVTGWLLVAVSAALPVLLGRPSAQEWSTRLLTLTTLVEPLAASGVGPVQVKGRDAEETEWETEQQEKAGLIEPLKTWEALP